MGLKDRQIMIIDDDDTLCRLLDRVLTTVGCKVSISHSIKEALSKLKTVSPDLIILDLAMPELDGFTFLKFRKMNTILSLIPVIVLSGTRNKKEIQLSLELGADQFLEKPFEARIVLQKIRFIFSSKEKFVFRFPISDLPQAEAEVNAELLEQSFGRLKVESQVRFAAGKAVQIHSEDYVKNSGTEVVCRVDSRYVELVDGMFRTVLSASGLDAEAKKHFEQWQRTLSK